MEPFVAVQIFSSKTMLLKIVKLCVCNIPVIWIPNFHPFHFFPSENMKHTSICA